MHITAGGTSTGQQLTDKHQRTDRDMMSAATIKALVQAAGQGRVRDAEPAFTHLLEQCGHVRSGILAHALKDAAIAAAVGGHNDMLTYLERASRFKWDWNDDDILSKEAAAHGHLHVIKHLHSMRMSGFALGVKLSIQTAVSYLPAYHGYIDILQWLHTNNCQFDAGTCAMAAQGGHLDILKWLVSINCPKNSNTCMLAAQEGHLDVLEYAHKQEFEMDYATATEAAREGHENTLSYALVNKVEISGATLGAAAGNGHKEIVKLLIANQCPCDASSFCSAARNGNTKMIRWLMETYGARPDASACAAAAEGGKLATLQWLRKRAVPWDTQTCADASKTGHLEVLQWAISNGCPWDGRVFTFARMCNQRKVLEWAVSLATTELPASSTVAPPEDTSPKRKSPSRGPVRGGRKRARLWGGCGAW